MKIIDNGDGSFRIDYTSRNRWAQRLKRLRCFVLGHRWGMRIYSTRDAAAAITRNCERDCGTTLVKRCAGMPPLTEESIEAIVRAPDIDWSVFGTPTRVNVEKMFEGVESSPATLEDQRNAEAFATELEAALAAGEPPPPFIESEGTPTPGWFYEQMMKARERQKTDPPNWNMRWLGPGNCPWCGVDSGHGHDASEADKLRGLRRQP